MNKIGNQSEREFRDKQTQFGHLHRGKDLRSWLNDTYRLDETRENRYHRVAQMHLDTSHRLKVLEIAAGVGDFVMYCANLFPQHEYFANELSEPQLKGNINAVADYFGVEKIPELSFGPVEELGYEANSFDLIFIKAAVHHFENPKLGLENIHRILKPGGKLVFFEEPVCLDIPIYKYFVKKNFSLRERSLGINEHIYTLSDYYSFGEIFRKKIMHLDEVLVNEYDKQQEKRKGFKEILGKIVRKSPFLFRNFMIWRFTPFVFIFEK